MCRVEPASSAKRFIPTWKMWSRVCDLRSRAEMKANETSLQSIIEGTKQYIVPLFQRSYSWGKKQWQALWDDLVDLCESDCPRTHFIGAIVTMQTVSVPEGVPKYLLIDGQQ